MKKYLVVLLMLSGCSDGMKFHKNDCVVLHKESGLSTGWYKILDLKESEYGFTAKLQNLTFEDNLVVFIDKLEIKKSLSIVDCRIIEQFIEDKKKETKK